MNPDSFIGRGERTAYELYIIHTSPSLLVKNKHVCFWSARLVRRPTVLVLFLYHSKNPVLTGFLLWSAYEDYN